MGDASGEVAERAAGRHGGVFLSDQLQGHRRVEGGNRLVRSGHGEQLDGARGGHASGFSGWDRGQTVPGSGSAAVVFADWLIDAENPWFSRNIVNRVWSWLLGRGIVHEPDDIRPDNPPSNPELLAFLEKELVGAKYDLKHVYRLILNSQTYQLSSVAQQRPARRPRPTSRSIRCAGWKRRC